MNRVLRRLERAERSRNHGRIMKYGQWKRWLCSSVLHLPGTLDERTRLVETLTGEHALCDETRSHRLTESQMTQSSSLMRSAGEIYGHIIGLWENAVDLLRTCGEALRTPEGPLGNDDDEDDYDNDESMGPAETESERRARYLRDPMEEYSDPELRTLLNYGPSADSDEQQEF
eukprot:s848_g13.t1